ncbi:MAG: PAS domain-containing sensor histidine kinase [Saprospiraceae bacterium]|nr:PAS domain-containing sensor histidine kinase [Saprospiraceae bacterium]
MSSSSQELISRLEAVIETAIDGIITINTDGIMETVNPAAEAMFGYERGELLGQKVNILMNKEDRKKHDSYIHNYLETREPQIIGIGREVMGRTKDGKIFPCRLAVSEVLLNDRIIFTGILHDLTEIHQAKSEVEKLNRELEQKVQERTNELEEVVNKLLRTNLELAKREQQLNEALNKERELGELKSRFVSMASHEFRTPLSTILSSASLIRRYAGEEHQSNRERHIEKIKRSVDNLTGILNDFLSLSKLEEGKVGLELKEVDLEELCRDIKEDLSGIMGEGQEISLSKKGSSVIRTDERTIRNVMFNLLSNAIKYSPQQSEVRCSMESRSDKIVIKVEDDGIGIPVEDQKYIFTRFFRAQNVENIQGTGLGLNIVKRYIDLLDGEISFKSQPGEGTTFQVKLPINE